MSSRSGAPLWASCLTEVHLWLQLPIIFSNYMNILLTAFVMQVLLNGNYKFE